MLTDMYNTKMESIKEEVKNSSANCALTSDFWTSLGNESYCGIICHWIADDWNLKSVVLECVHVIERHYSANVAELYKQFAKERQTKIHPVKKETTLFVSTPFYPTYASLVFYFWVRAK